MSAAKSFSFSKQEIYNAWLSVKAAKGKGGVDGVDLLSFEADLKNNLYKVWNRMSSGSYFPDPVKGLEIPKPNGKKRRLGIPTISDRVAQTVVKNRFEPGVEKVFLEDSYGYRPLRSAHQAIETTRKRCWKIPFLLEFDIVGLFDNISHELLMKVVEKHTDDPAVLLYIRRWITAPMVFQGQQIERTKGVPQGGVISPVLSNLFLHYAFDLWMQRSFPTTPICRYADDGIAHCYNLSHAKTLKARLHTRMAECGLELHPDKTKIVCCNPKLKLDLKSLGVQRSFDFLGFRFQPRSALARKDKSFFLSFTPAISPAALKRIRDYVRKKWKIRSKSNLSIEELASFYRAQIQGWFDFYKKFRPSELSKLARFLNDQIIRWAKAKYTNLRTGKGRAISWLKRVYKTNPSMFPHWKMFAVN